jgi:REP element-mobilizing transposase RayT
MSYVSNWLHCVWGTKWRHPYLTGNVRAAMISHILENARMKKIYIDCLNGSTEHLHCLLSLDPDKSLSQVMQLIKGESSYWINRQNLVTGKFSWAVEYYAGSLSVSDLPRVRKYILNQEKHHKVVSCEQEIETLVEVFGLVEFGAKAPFEE